MLCTALQKTLGILLSHIYQHFMDFIYLDEQDMTDQSFSRYPSGFVLRKRLCDDVQKWFLSNTTDWKLHTHRSCWWDAVNTVLFCFFLIFILISDKLDAVSIFLHESCSWWTLFTFCSVHFPLISGYTPLAPSIIIRPKRAIRHSCCLWIHPCQVPLL